MPSLIIEDATLADVRVQASALELQNRKKLMDGLAYNRGVTARKKKEAAEVIGRAAEIGAEYIHDASTKTRTVRLDDYVGHYHPNN